jgi:hypothetical protein
VFKDLVGKHHIKEVLLKANASEFIFRNQIFCESPSRRFARESLSSWVSILTNLPACFPSATVYSA